MSNSLVRTSLELFGYEKNSKKGAQKRRRNASKSTLDLIPKQHRITKKNKRDNPSRSARLSLEEAKKRPSSCIDQTEENVRRLLLLGGKKLDSDTANKLVNRALDKGCARPKKKERESEEGTAFTEEDFAKFEAEYSEL